MGRLWGGPHDGGRVDVGPAPVPSVVVTDDGLYFRCSGTDYEYQEMA